MSQESPTGKGGQGHIGGALPIAPDQNVGGGAGQPDTTPSPARKPRRWPIWSEPQTPSVPCNICGFAGSHSTVCPFGPEPTRSKVRR